MKNSPLITTLLCLLAASALASVFLCGFYISNTREFRTLQLQAAKVQHDRSLFNSLLNDVVEYSKHNPAINPILDTLKPKTAAAATTKPAAK
jgi:hypothetical protein